jgi:hypothetical protein
MSETKSRGFAVRTKNIVKKRDSNNASPTEKKWIVCDKTDVLVLKPRLISANRNSVATSKGTYTLYQNPQGIFNARGETQTSKRS